MRILSLDTSFSFFNLSVVEEGKVVLLHYLDSKRKTLENLPKVLEELSVRPENFDAFAVSVGVGYLTSLRIGITFMKTTAYLLRRPIVGYENLDLLGRFTPVEGRKIPYLKVSTNVFYRVLSRETSEIKVYKGERLEGTGITLKAFGEVRIGSRQVFHPFFPFSAYGGLLAWERLRENPEGDDPMTLEPVYLKPPA
jgi:tRNA A37 threonylcarbamoyladenosine modification protein TsaB